MTRHDWLRHAAMADDYARQADGRAIADPDPNRRARHISVAGGWRKAARDARMAAETVSGVDEESTFVLD